MAKEKNKTSVPKEFGYFDKYQDRRIDLTPKPDELVVTLQPAPGDADAFTETESVNESEGIDGVEKSNLKRGIAVLRVSDQSESLEVANSIDRPEILNSIPAFVDSDGNTRYFLPDEVTVRFKKSVGDAEAEAVLLELGSEILIRQRTKGYFTVAVPEGKNAFEMIKILNDRDDVRFAETSEIGFDDALVDPPSDARFDELWGLHNTGQTVNGVTGSAGADIRVLEAWDTTTGSENVIIAVIDTGMQLDHPDLETQLLDRDGQDWDFASNDGSPDDSGSHGTHVCGTCAAASNNSIGVAGVAPGCRLMPLRINLTAGMNANRADAIEFVTTQAQTNTNRRYVVNCSWRASGSFTAILSAIDDAVDSGVVVIFAAGNAGKDMDIDGEQFPGAHPTAIAVAALDSSDQRASFSNHGSQVDLSAPGVHTLSTIPSSSYDFKSGTSMAAPHVAGVAALVWSTNMSLTNHEVRQVLENSCDDISAANPGMDGKLGSGRINAATAVQAAVSSPI